MNFASLGPMHGAGGSALDRDLRADLDHSSCRNLKIARRIIRGSTGRGCCLRRRGSWRRRSIGWSPC